MINTFTQEQINALEQSYQEEIKKLCTVKANYSLALLSLKNQIAAKDKKIAELEKQIEDAKPKKGKPKT